MGERERDPYYFNVPYTSTTYGLQATWGLGNQTFVFPGKKALLLPGNNRDKSLHSQGANVQITEVKWETEMHSPAGRKLANESHGIFVALQGQLAENNGANAKKALVMASKHYRSILKARSMELCSLIETADEEGFTYQEQMKDLNMTELIWNLCEILWIDVTPGGVVIPQLLEWLRWHFVEGETMLRELRSDPSPEHSHGYWDCIYKLLLQGQIDSVRYLLSRNSDSNTDAFKSMDEVLRKMPQFTQLQGSNSVSEFEMKWRHWKDDCERRMEEGHFATNMSLETVARILCGEEEIFSELKDLCETWYHMLVSKLLYQKPTVRSVDLYHYIHGCMDEFRNDDRITELDRILISALEFDIFQVIEDCRAVLGGSWFIAHLTDILHHCGPIKSHRFEFGFSLREHLLLDYAVSLMSHKSLWQIAVDYFDHCGDKGREYLENFIDNMPINTEKKANKVLAVCEKRNMTEQIKSICKVMGMRCIQRQRLGSALSWFLRSKDVTFATRIAEKFLLEYNEQGYFSNLDLLDNLGPSMLLSNTLTFLGKYREYHRLYEDKDFYAAGSLLFSLLTSRLAPREFWLTLFRDATTLLEAKEMIFGSQETYELMHCLEELKNDRLFLSPDTNTDDLSDLKETIHILNLSLTRNLARSIIIEGSRQNSL